MTMYEITGEIKTLEDMIETFLVDADGNPREIAPEERDAMLALVDEIQGKFSEKAERICRYMADVQAVAAACKAEAIGMYFSSILICWVRPRRTSSR